MARKKETEAPVCPLCGEPVDRELYAINFTQLIGIASWHIDFSPRVRVCATCVRSFNAYVSRWYAERNKTGQYDKFPMD